MVLQLALTFLAIYLLVIAVAIGLGYVARAHCLACAYGGRCYRSRWHWRDHQAETPEGGFISWSRADDLGDWT